MDHLNLDPRAYDSSLAWHSDYPMLWYALGGLWLTIREWLWNHGGYKLYWGTWGDKRPPIKKWWIRWCNPGFMPCPGCGYNFDWAEPDGWFKFTKGGESFDGEYTSHWFEGIQTCPRCRRCWEYGDSD